MKKPKGNGPRVYMLCPVRNAPPDVERQLAKYARALEKHGYRVHYPRRDTPQDDPHGFQICRTNGSAIFDADEVHVWWDPASEGSKFDFGMLFMLLGVLQKTKRVVIINYRTVKPTPDKSFENVLLKLAGLSR